MEFRLLVDLEVVDFLQSQPPHERRRLLDHLRQLQSFPLNLSDLKREMGNGRQLDISVFNGLAICYWIDMADRQVKILSITAAS